VLSARISASSLEISTMPFSIGLLELAAVTVVAVFAITAFLRRDDRYRWLVAATVCAALGSLLTPADIGSMLVMSCVLIGVFTMGAVFPRRRREV
jgi:multisubunit Na+/H+ antiporter MnhG subunit